MINKLNLFIELIHNPVTKKILAQATKYCEKCGKNRLEVALELFVGVRDDACFKCKTVEKFVSSIIEVGARAFNTSVDEIKEKFKDAHWRKGLASVIKGLAVFGVRKPFVPGAPFLVVWDVTYACNLKCKHCYSSAGSVLNDELTTDEAKTVIDKLDGLGVTAIAFSGGEPLLRKDIFELIEYASSRGIYTAMATNGTLISKDIARKLKDLGLGFVQISLDGRKETHDRFRGVEGAFDRTIEGIKNCVDAGLFVNVAMTVTKLNLRDVPYVVNLCENLGVNWFMFYNFIPTGRGRDIVELDLTPEEREELLVYLYEKNKNSNISLLSTAPQFARVSLQREMAIIPTHFYNIKRGKTLKDLAEFIGGCGAGRFYISLKPNGDIQPCVFFPLKLGNILEIDDLDEFWQKTKVLEDLRNKDILKGCGKCEYRYYCGGCRARAYNYFGDYLAPDPGCVRNLVYYKALKVSEVEKICGEVYD